MLVDQPYAMAVHRLPLRDESDVAAARRRARAVGESQRLPLSAVEALATAVTEITRNVIVHADTGEIFLYAAHDRGRAGVIAIVRDSGPGIPSIEQAMLDGHSTGEGLGLGLPSARRLVDEFELCTSVDEGTTITLKQWHHATPR